jgi:hypothetical protein
VLDEAEQVGERIRQPDQQRLALAKVRGLMAKLPRPRENR